MTCEYYNRKLERINKILKETSRQRERALWDEQLKPCPFCGGRAHIHNAMENDGPCHYESIYVECEDCGAKSATKFSDGYFGCCTDEQIAALWNRRSR